MSPKDHPNEMNILEHLEELRSRLIKVLLAVALASAFSFIFSGRILDFLVAPARLYVREIYFLGPLAAFLVRLNVALFSGVLFSSPYIFYQAWMFAAPGLHAKEKRIVIPAVTFSAIFFAAGAAFAYAVIVPTGLGFLLRYRTETLKPFLEVERYLEFVITLLIASGVIFNLPVFVVGLTKLGVVTAASLGRSRKVFIVAAFVAAAVITPSTDPVTQFFMAVPLIFLYEMSIRLSAFLEKRESQKRT